MEFPFGFVNRRKDSGGTPADSGSSPCYRKNSYPGIETSDGAVTAPGLLIATGSRYQHLDIPGEMNTRSGRAFLRHCDGPFTKANALP